MSARLRRFTPAEVILSSQDAHAVLLFFSITPGILPNAMTVEDRAFAQALLVEAIDASYDMGLADALFHAVGMKPFASLGGVGLAVAQFAGRAVANWFEHASAAEIRDPKIYETVRLVIAQNWATVWQIRVLTGKLTY